jgi:glycosyltransferase involved in cell wall biosynthesis
MRRRRHVVAFANGPVERVEAMREDLRRELPEFEHHLVRDESWMELVERFPPFSIAHTAALLGPETDAAMRLRALALAPTRMLAYGLRGDRFHLSWRSPLASLLFWNGAPVDRVHWRPWKDDTVHYGEVRRIVGKAERPGKLRVGVLSPYVPWPLSHGGAVRIYSLLREASVDCNVALHAFAEESDEGVDWGPLLEVCSELILVRKPRVRRWWWCSFLPVEAIENESPAMRDAWAKAEVDVRQVEFTQLASYAGDVLVEHDVTMDLAAQEARRSGTLAAAWSHWRWERFETGAWKRFASVVAMSERDRAQIDHAAVTVLANGVDLERFACGPEAMAARPRLLFVGSFRHFPNALAYRFLAEEFWPELRKRWPEAELEVVSGPRAESYYPFGAIPRPDGLVLRGFVERVEDCYASANLVLIATPVSAGTNIKALEAMAAGRAIVSTPSGVHGLGLVHGESVLVAEGVKGFVEACDGLLCAPELRARQAAKARQVAEARYSWRGIAAEQVKLWKRLAK